MFSNGVVIDRQRGERGFHLKGFKIMKNLGKGSFGKIMLARKKSTVGQSSSEELFALKFVRYTHMNKIEKEVLFRAVGHPFLVQLHAYFRTRVNCSFMHSMTMH
jgi:serine/threonine protein kinase